MTLRLGRRGAVLALLGVIYLLVGVAHLTTPASDYQQNVLRVLVNVAPLSVWGVAWVTLGLMAVVAAFLRQRHPRLDTLGYTSLAGLATLWAAGYGATAIAFGVSRSLLGLAVWGALAGTLFIIAGWPETAER